MISQYTLGLSLEASSPSHPQIADNIMDSTQYRRDNLATMKLQQRSTVTQNQVQERKLRNNQLAGATARLQHMSHTDSGIRFVDATGDVPPEYTQRQVASIRVPHPKC